MKNIFGWKTPQKLDMYGRELKGNFIIWKKSLSEMKLKGCVNLVWNVVIPNKK